MTSAKYGLFSEGRSVPLQHIDCHVRAGELISRAQVKQIYELSVTREEQDEDDKKKADSGTDKRQGGSEVKFHFPLETHATVHEFTVQIDH